MLWDVDHVTESCHPATQCLNATPPTPPVNSLKIKLFQFSTPPYLHSSPNFINLVALSSTAEAPMLSRVVLYGYDALLLSTRELLLQHAGFEVRSTSDHKQLMRLLYEHAPNLLIVCHTIPEPECHAVLMAAHAARPAPKTLVLTTRFSGPCETGEDSVLTLDGPQTLLAAARQLVQNREPSSQPSNQSQTGRKLCHSSQAR